MLYPLNVSKHTHHQKTHTSLCVTPPHSFQRLYVLVSLSPSTYFPMHCSPCFPSSVAIQDPLDSCCRVLFRYEAIRADASEATGSSAWREGSATVDQGVPVSGHDKTHRHTEGVPCTYVHVCG